MSRVSGTREGTGTPSMADQQARALEEHQRLRVESAGKKKQASGGSKMAGGIAIQGAKVGAKVAAQTSAKLATKAAAKVGTEVGKAAAKASLNAAKAVPYLNIVATAVDIGVTAATTAIDIAAAVEEGNANAAVEGAASGAVALGSQGYQTGQDAKGGSFSVSKAEQGGQATLEAAYQAQAGKE